MAVLLLGNAACSGDSDPAAVTEPQGPNFTAWTELSSGTVRNLHDVYMITDEVAVAVGDSGTILRTVDGGDSWQEMNSYTTANLYSVSFSGPMRGIVVGAGGVVLYTPDSGLAWYGSQSGTDETLFDVDLVSESFGVAVGSKGTILRTYSAGQSWTAVWDEAVGWRTLDCVSFADANTGIVAGINGTDVFRTTDGGASWAHVSGVYGSRAVDFADPLNGVVVGLFFEVFSTNDAGDTWLRVYEPAVALTTYAVSFPTPESGAVAAAGDIFRTDTGGEEWTRQEVSDIQGIHMLRIDTGLGVGRGGTIVRTRP